MLRPYRPRELAIECEVLLAHVLGVRRAALHAHPERRLDDLERAELEALVSRRLAREPVAYLVGRREFFGLEVLVDRRVLIPRPETEHLVERAIAEVGRLGRQDVCIADVGTGSGAIAIALAKHLPQAKLFAIDLSAAALEVAAINCRRLGVAGRVTLLHGDLLAPLPEAVDVIVANLPYVAPEEMAGLAPEVTRFEPRRALIADDGGMLYYNRLLAQAKAYLRPAGVIVCEIAPHQAVPLLARIGEALPGATTGIDNDLAGHDRVLWLRLPAQTIHYAGSSRSSFPCTMIP